MLSFKKALMERVLGGELTHHLGYGRGEVKPEETPNHRNGTRGKTVLTDSGAVRIEVSRDRAGTFEPLLIAKHERRFEGFDDKILALYARGMTVREIQGYLAEMYTVEVSADFIRLLDLQQRLLEREHRLLELEQSPLDLQQRLLPPPGRSNTSLGEPPTDEG